MKNSNTIEAAKSSQVNDQNKTEVKVGSSFEELYKKKEYKDAASYLMQNRQRLSSGTFHYNLGTVYSKVGDFPIARFHLEKAIKEGFVNSSSLNNLSYVKSKLQVDDVSTSNNFNDQLLNVALNIPSSAYLSMTLIFTMIGILLFKSKIVFKKISIAILVTMALTPILFSQLYLEKINYAVAFKDVPEYEGPSKIFAEKGKVLAGSKIILGDYKDGWFYIQYPISLAGWVSKDQLGLY